MLERAIVSGIAHDTSEVKTTIAGVPDQPGIVAAVFRPLADAGLRSGLDGTVLPGRHEGDVPGPGDDLDLRPRIALAGEPGGRGAARRRRGRPARAGRPRQLLVSVSPTSASARLPTSTYPVFPSAASTRSGVSGMSIQTPTAL